MSVDPLQQAAEKELNRLEMKGDEGISTSSAGGGGGGLDGLVVRNAFDEAAADEENNVDGGDDNDEEADRRDPVLIQLIESSRDMRRRAQRVSNRDGSINRDEFVKKLGIEYADTVDPATGMSCLDSTDADRAYYGHRDDAAYVAYRTSLLQLLDDLQWLKREKFIADSVKEDAVLLEYIQQKLAATERCLTCSMTLARCKCHGSKAPGMADVQSLMHQSAVRANDALRRAQVLADGMRSSSHQEQPSPLPPAQKPSHVAGEIKVAASQSEHHLSAAEVLSAARLKMITEYRDSPACAERLLSNTLHPEAEEVRSDSIRPLLARNRQAAAYKSSLMQNYRERKEAGVNHHRGSSTSPRRPSERR